VAPVIGSFSIVFDNSVDFREQSTGITFFHVNMPLDAPVGLAYGAAADVLIIGSPFNGVQSVGGATDDIAFGIQQFFDCPSPGGCGLRAAGVRRPLHIAQREHDVRAAGRAGAGDVDSVWHRGDGRSPRSSAARWSACWRTSGESV
jgi:hypothetical protein